jgi:hypothetical protein
MALKINPLLKPHNELKDGIENLRPLVREIAEAFVAQTEAGIAALLAALDKMPETESGSKAARRQEKLLDEMQARVAGLKVKPGKARLKDFRRVRDLLDELNQLAPQFNK